MTRTADLTGPRARPARAVLHRWILDPATGRVTEEPLDDQEIEFPAVDGDRLGRPARYLYTVTGALDPCAVVKYDLTTGHSTRYLLDPDTVIGEAVFTPGTDAPRETTPSGSGSRQTISSTSTDATATHPAPAGFGGREEDEGWLLSIATRRDGSASRLLVLDAADLAAGPVAAVELPRGVPTGFHGSWLPG